MMEAKRIEMSREMVMSALNEATRTVALAYEQLERDQRHGLDKDGVLTAPPTLKLV